MAVKLSLRLNAIIASLLSSTCISAVTSPALATCPATVTSAQGPCTLGNGQSVTVTNTGSLSDSGSNINDIELSGAGIIAGDVTNQGTLTTGTTGIYINDGGAGVLLNDTTGIINAHGTGIYADGGANVTSMTNNGSITTAVFDAMQNHGSTVGSMTNGATGVITTNGNFVNDSVGMLVNGGGVVTNAVTNLGQINTNIAGIDLYGGAAGSVNNGGTITSGVDGIYLNDNSTVSNDVTNSGTINANGGNGIHLDGSAVGGAINNTQSGYILANNTGIYLANNSSAGSVVNDGYISAALNDGIQVDGSTINGDVTNSSTGIIETNGNTANYSVGILVNNGGAVSGAIQNAGSITSNIAGVEVLGSVAGSINNNGGNIDSAMDGILVVNDGATQSVINHDISNSGFIQANGGVGIGIVNSTVSGDINNSHSISASTNGIAITGGSVAGDINNQSGGGIFTSNNGILVQDNAGTRSTAGNIINAGTINTTSGTNGINIDNSDVTGNITNAQGAVLTVNNSGIWLNNGATANAITNAGTITSIFNNGIHVSGSTVATNVVNTSTGVITTNGNAADNAVGILLSDGGTITGVIENAGQINTNIAGIEIFGSTAGGINNNGGTITSDDDGILVADQNGTAATVNGNISNSGTITATNGAGIDVIDSNMTGDIINSNVINSMDAAISVSSNTAITGNITNSGSLTATFSNGLLINNSTVSGDVSNTSSGVITSTNGAFDAVLLNGSTIGSFSNAGTISSQHLGVHILNSTIDNDVINTATGVLDAVDAALVVQNSSVNNVTNNGTITSTSGNGIDVNSLSNVAGNITNSHIINAATSGILVRDGTTVSGNVVNSGTVNTTDDTYALAGIDIENSTIYGKIYNPGTINAGQGSSSATGIQVAGSTVSQGIINANIINSDSAGIHSYQNNMDSGIFNSGTITSGGNGIDVVADVGTFNGDIKNTGVISAGGNGISVDSGIINGSLINGSGGNITTDNVGISVGASTANVSVNGITNNGSITAADGIAISGGFNTATTGDITNALYATITSSEVGIFLDSTTGTSITNGGVIDASNGLQGIDVQGASTLSGGITNSGAIVSEAQGIVVSSSTVSGLVLNSGIIDTLNVVTPSTVQGDGISALFSTVGGVKNTGIINAELAGIRLQNATVNGDVLNDTIGSITANIDDGISLSGTTISGAVSNNGQISSVAANGLEIFGSSTVSGMITNASGALIAGATNGISIADTSTTGAIQNNGIILGTSGAALAIDNSQTGTITNAGTLSGTYAVNITAPTSALVFNNSGTLDGAIKIENTTLNLNSGTIASGTIGGAGGVLNINTNLATASSYGGTDGSLAAINIGAGKTFTAETNGISFAANDFNNNGTFRVMGNSASSITANVTGDYAQATGGILAIDAQLPTVHSSLNVSGTANMAAGTGLYVNITGNQFDFSNSAIIHNALTAGTLNASTFNVTDSSYLFNFIPIINGNAIDLQSVQDNTSTISQAVANLGNSANNGAAQALDNLLINNHGGDANNVINALGSLTTQQQVAHAAAEATPAISGGTTTAVLYNMDTVNQIIEARNSADSGLSSGDAFTTNGNFWLKPYGSWSNQDSHNGATGYDSNTYGIIGGADKIISDNTRLGTAFAYGNSKFDANDVDQTVKVNSYQGFFYGSYSLDSQTEANFQLDGGYNTNDSTRHIDFGGLDRNAGAHYGSWTEHVGTGVGHVFNLGGSETTFAPSARIDYSAIENEAYTESNAGALNLKVNSQFTDQLIPAAEAKLNHKFGRFNASLNGGLGYNVLNSRNSITSSFVGGGSAFVTRGIDPSPWVVRSGAGLSYQASDSLDLNLRYDREDRGSQFDNQTVSLKASYKF